MPEGRTGKSAAQVTSATPRTSATAPLAPAPFFVKWTVPATALIAILIGGAYLVAWLTGIAPRWSATGVITMKTNMSASLVLAGTALLLVDPRRAKPSRLAGMVLASAVLLVGALTLFEHLFQEDLGIDQLLATEAPGAVLTASPNRIGPVGSFSLMLLGGGLLAVTPKLRVAPYLGLATAVVNLVPATGFLYGIDRFYGESSLTAIAWPTVIALLSLSLGLVLAPGREGPFGLVWRDDPGGALLRRMLPAAVLVPLALQFVGLEGERAGIYGRATGSGVRVISLVLFLLLLLWRSASRVSAAAARAREAQQHAIEELREADRRKDEFLGILSHELRNPLAPIRNALHILEHADPTGQQARRANEIIGRQVAHLVRLVDDLLEVTRISRGKIRLRRRRLDVRDLVRRTGEDHRSLIQARGLEYVIDTPRQPVWVDGDETRLAQVIGNLLQNAVKFTPTAGRVTLSLTVLRSAAEIRVRDTGAGIDPALLGHIFEPFFQAEQSLARTEGGLGLGLALVKGLTELHGGSVEATSGGQGAGAEFIVRIPTVAGTEAGPSIVPGHPAAQRSLRVMVVDDNVDAADSLADLVRMGGHQVEVAYDGPTAIEKATASAPDLVFCDIGMPGMSGYDLARTVRSNPALNAVRLVAVSGYARPEDLQRAAEAGFVGHIAKPPDPAMLEQFLG